MKRSGRQRQSSKQKLKMRLILIAGGVSFIMALCISWLIFLNISNNPRTHASDNDGGGIILNNGEIISEFTWEKDPPLKATLGPDAIKISSVAHTSFGGRSSTGGLAPGKPAQDINMEIASSPLFDVEGMDVSIDFKRREPSGSFFTRGKSLDFGFKKGIITISYRVFAVSGNFETVAQTTEYEIPQDEQFRNLRFMYTPTTGKGEIFVNNVVVWSHQGEKNTAMYWNDAGNIFIGKGIDGGGIDQPIFDNLVMRTTGSVSPLAESLINFMLEPSGSNVKVHWSTTANDKVDFFTIERSVNGVNFANLVNIPCDPQIKEEEEYVFVDQAATSPGVLFYRIRQTFKDGKFITHSTSAVKIQVDKALTIDRVSPTIFQNTFNLAYYIPSSGRVWVQLVDQSGKIRSSETFMAQQGKNIYIFRDKNTLSSGDYTVNLVFDERKVSTKVTKA